MRQCLDRRAALLAYPAEGPAGELLDLHGVPMRYVTIAGLFGIWLANPAQAQTMPPAFEDTAQIVCVERADSIELLAVYEKDIAIGDQLLALLAEQGVCERATFSGKPVVDLYKTHPIGTQREGHVFEVDVTGGEVLQGRRKAYMLLFVMHDNEV
jgi:hypothetical protein